MWITRLVTDDQVWYNESNKISKIKQKDVPLMVKNNNRADRGANRKAGNAPQLSPEQKKSQLAKDLRLKPKTKQMVDNLIDNPKLSQTQAYIDTHDTTNRKTAAIAASKLLQKPNVQIYKQSAVIKAKKRVVQLVDSDNEAIALKASDSIIDRVEGKPLQKNETTQRTVEVKLDLTGLRIGAHYLPSVPLPMIEE